MSWDLLVAVHDRPPPDGRALHADRRWSCAARTLFATLARRATALYACAVVERGVIAGRGISYDRETESVRLPASSFTGLPRVPTWLAWFGPEYVPLVAPALRASGVPVDEAGTLLAGGPEPMDADQLRGSFPAFPDDLMVTWIDDAPPGMPRERAGQLPSV